MADHPKVFISYARKDGERFATELRRRLELKEPEITLWQDRAKMEGGVGWWKQITDALDVVEFLVLVMTPMAMQSPVARREWRYARQQGVCVYPVKGVPDADLNYAELPQWMRKAHFFDLDCEWETFVNYLKSPCHAARVPFMAPELPEGFVERPDVFNPLLAHVLSPSRTDPIAVTTALRGAGGLGKTTMATALCHHDDVIAAFDDGILWVTLGQRPNIEQALTKLYAAITSERPAFVDEEDATVNLAERLESKTCLIVIDDVWDPLHLRPFLRGGSGCCRLITTRHLDVAAGAERVDVDEMTMLEATSMLTVRLPRLPRDPMLLRSLADRLGRWPLLLELAGASLALRIQRGDDVEGALGYLHTKLDRQGVLAFDNRNATQRSQALAKTIEVSLEVLEPDDRGHAGELAILPEDVDVPLDVVGTLWNVDAFDAGEIAQRLDAASIVRFSLQAGTLRMHDVIRAYLASRLTDAAGLHARLLEAWGDPRTLRSQYAWRWVPYHLMAAERADDLRHVLGDFDWMDGKLRATEVTALVSDYELFPHDDDLQLIQGALRLSSHLLSQDKSQLAGQLLGRLASDASPVVSRLREQASRWRGAAWLRPLRPFLTAPGGSLICTLAGHTGRVRAVVVSPDALRAVSASDDRTLKVWDLEQCIEERTLVGHSDWIRAVAITGDGRHVISSSDDHTIRVWDIETGAEELIIDAQNTWVCAVAITPDGDTIASATDDGSMTFWRRDGTRHGTVKAHAGKVNAVAVTCDGRLLVSAGDDRTLRVWDIARRETIRVLRGHAAKVMAITISADGHYVLSAGADEALFLWDLAPDAGDTPLALVTRDAYWVRAVSFLPDHQKVLSASQDHHLRMWDVEMGAEERTFAGHTDCVNALSVTRDGRRAVSASDDHTVKLWDLRSTVTQPSVESHSDSIRAVAITPDGKTAISTSDDQTLRVWDLERVAVRKTYPGVSHWVMALLPDGEHVISAAGDASVRVWRLADGSERCWFRKHTDRIRAIVAAPDGRTIVSAADDRTIRLWDIEDGRQQLEIPLQSHWIRGLAIAPSREFVLSAADGPSLKVWRLADGAEIMTLRGHTARVNAVIVTSGGTRAISASNDHTLIVWDLDGSRLALQLRGHRDHVNGVAMMADGIHVVSASSDHTIRVWNVITGALIATYTGESPMLACAVDPQGSRIVAGDQAGLLHVVRVEGMGS